MLSLELEIRARFRGDAGSGYFLNPFFFNALIKNIIHYINSI